MQFMVEGLRYATLEKPFIRGLKPYDHQRQTLEHVRKAMTNCQTICIENTSITGSGKTLANFAAAILDGTRTCGIYPTNELMLDQYVSIRKHLPGEIAVLDSQGLDDIISDQSHMRTHAHALAWATGDDVRTAVLTNPDVLYLAMYNLYGQMFSSFSATYGVRVFQHMLNNYPVIAFDEFHLYSTKQIANAAFIMGTAKELAPDKPHIFIFSSATPQEQFKEYVKRLGMDVISVTDQPTQISPSRVVCEPIEINLLSADLLRWKGGDEIRVALDDILHWADTCHPHAKGVFIVDSVYEAKRLAEDLRRRYSPADVGEVHGYMNEDERADALLRRFSVGTTTIDVGVDLTDQKSKEFLVCEARSAAQAIQRIGRLGRHGRETAQIKVPNRVWLAVPDYVYNYIAHQGGDGSTITRQQLNQKLRDAYLDHESFAAYTKKYSPLEAVAACERILRHQYFEDTKVGAQEKLHHLVPLLYDKEPPTTQEQVEKSYGKYHKCQLAVWHKFGTEVKNPSSRSKQYYLSDLESFRGGLESDFTVAIYDDLDEQLGFKPIKTYTLPFVLRRTQSEELSEKAFEELVRSKHPGQANEWLLGLKRQGKVLGYVHVHELIDGKANKVYFEVDKLSIGSEFQRVVRLKGLTIDGDNVHLRTGEQSINGQLKKLSLNCWVSEQKSFSLSESLHLPPLFAIYPLHALNRSGRSEEWSVAFGLDAFLLDSIAKQIRWQKRRSNESAIIL